MLGRLGPMEIGVILLIAVIVFGPRQIPKIGRSLGESIREFRKVAKELHGEDEADADA